MVFQTSNGTYAHQQKEFGAITE